VDSKSNIRMSVARADGENAFLLRAISISDRINGLFDIDIELLGDYDRRFDAILGEALTVSCGLPQGGGFVHGYVARFEQTGSAGRFASYRATLRPWLWFLTRTSDCRIFQRKTVPDIVKEVFRDNGFTDFEERLVGNYSVREYCVQYRETDFNFVSRLLEQEGIYYYFRHEEGKHVLVLADGRSAHSFVTNYESIPYYPPDIHDRQGKNHIYDWSVAQHIQPGIYALNDYDFKKPRSSLLAKSVIKRDHAYSDGEIYDYPGHYWNIEQGQIFARARIEELHAQFEQVRGSTNARGLAVGALFRLTGYPREDQNREYLVTSTTIHLQTSDYESGGGDSGPEFSCSFTAIDSQQPYRPPRTTPKPVVQGPQTAIVVGKSGEEIWTDEYGRIKVQFHWDRDGRLDENSSCWVRVAQPWTGKNWGAMHIPRVGQEVIVEFLEGDPDRPIVTGCVYNRDNMPPYPLPEYKTRTTLKSQSSKGGGGCNELRFEDRKGSEQIFVHAQRDMDQRVRSDLREFIGKDHHVIVKGSERRLTDGDRHSQIKGSRYDKVSGRMSLEVSGQRDEKIGTVYAVESGQEIHLKSGAKLIIEAGSQVSIKAGSAFVDIGPGGVTIQGATVKINSGGASGAGSGVNVISPETPQEAEDY
jgi:type VI secretion system secreted protein VgrG